MTAKTKMQHGFLARITFRPEYSVYFSESGAEVVEMLYTEDDDVYEFIEMMQECEEHILEATVLFPSGQIIDARHLSTNAQE